MARMNWDRVKVETNARRYGWVRATETYPPINKKVKTKRKRGPKTRHQLTPQQQEIQNQARAAAKMRKRLAHERQLQLAAEAAVAKAARKAAQQAQDAARREQQRKKAQEQRIQDAQREADPDYQARQAAIKAALQEAIRVRSTSRMKSVTVVVRTRRQSHDARRLEDQAQHAKAAQRQKQLDHLTRQAVKEKRNGRTKPVVVGKKRKQSLRARKLNRR